MILDGAMGSELLRLHPDIDLMTSSITHPELVKAIHETYLDAGADAITANTFSCLPTKLNQSDLENMIATSLDIACEATNRQVDIIVSLGPSGLSLPPIGTDSFEAVHGAYKTTFDILVQHSDKFEIILLETQTDLYEVKAALHALKQVPDLCAKQVWVTFTLEQNGCTLAGNTVNSIAAFADAWKLDAIGFNCGYGPECYADAIEKLDEFTHLPIILQPNAGIPQIVENKTVYTQGATEWVSRIEKLASHIDIVGGCCGTTPQHIHKLYNADLDYRMETVNVAKRSHKKICSANRVISTADKPIIIGERINPTRNKKVLQCLKEDPEYKYIQQIALEQVEAGADVLDVNVGSPEIDEAYHLPRVIQVLQNVVNTPLCIDSSNKSALISAARIYNGVPLINSLNAIELDKFYGCQVIRLLTDGEKILDDVFQRLKLANIMRYSCRETAMLYDPLVMPISVNPSNAKDIIKAVSYDPLTNMVIGLSNISFGMPDRKRINAEFFRAVTYAGIAAVICNPCEPQMHEAITWFKYLARGIEPVIEEHGHEAMTLTDAIYYGQQLRVEALFDSKLSRERAIDSIIVPAFESLDRDFANGTIFLPQLLKASECAKWLLDQYPVEVSNSTKAKVVFCTVKGDIHDIGKNIVIAMLRNFDYEVIDLGKDVDVNIILDTLEQNPDTKFLGLSALMTTSVKAMADTIAAVKAKYPQVEILVGGAVITQVVADMIGADGYSKDAMECVEHCDKSIRA